ncbi:hypothetical protein [Halarcobacter sp.]|nr:hypothetical protein [Halarcobacter sp.]
MKKSEKALIKKWNKALKKGKEPKFKSLYERLVFAFHFKSHC